MSSTIRLACSKNPPPDVNIGSQGPHVTPIHDFLISQGFGDGIIKNEIYGAMTSHRMSQFQRKYSLRVTGNFTPETRGKAYELEFDFRTRCMEIEGETDFVQSSDRIVRWSPKK
jgi:hypothetical protein